MKSLVIKLNSIVEVKKFVNIISHYTGEFKVSEGKYTVNGKSIMGVFSLDLKNNLSLRINSEENLSMLIHELKPYIVA